MRTIGATVLALSLISSSAFAAGESAAPLSPGKPAGTRQAALLGPNVFLVLIGVGVVIGGVALAVSNTNKNSVTTPTTSGTGS